MTMRAMQSEILRLKKERGVLVLAHSYERREVVEIADVTGDSYRLACAAKNAKEREVLVCAGCPMAGQLSAEELKKLKEIYQHTAVAAYVNTTARLKALADVCVTSSSAVKVLSRLDAKEILFVPDSHLGRYCRKRLPDKIFYFYEGGCPVHLQAQKSDVERMKAEYPEALLLAHPECRDEIVDAADYVGSTSGIMDFVKTSDATEFIIGTENTIAEHLRFEYPEKKFIPLSEELVCADMRLTTLKSVLNCLSSGGEEITLDEPLRLAAKRSLDKMIELGG